MDRRSFIYRLKAEARLTAYDLLTRIYLPPTTREEDFLKPGGEEGEKLLKEIAKQDPYGLQEREEK